MLVYESAIVDELGDVVTWCKDLSEKEIEEMLSRYPEASIKSIDVSAYGYDGRGDYYESC